MSANLEQALRDEVGVPEGDQQRIESALTRAEVYVNAAVGGATVPTQVLNDCIVSCAADLYNMRDARLGVMDVSGADLQPYRVSADPLRSVWPRLKAAGIITGSLTVA